MRGATYVVEWDLREWDISTHAPLAGRDGLNLEPSQRPDDHFNPRAPCGARQTLRLPCALILIISTHAPLAGRDRRRQTGETPSQHFNPRAPCGARPRPWRSRCSAGYFNPRAPCGARHQQPCGHGRKTIFQPTRPLRGATGGCKCSRGAVWDFNPRAPCGARRLLQIWTLKRLLFQPTRPLRGATVFP